jgi:hypothetical protein
MRKTKESLTLRQILLYSQRLKSCFSLSFCQKEKEEKKLRTKRETHHSKNKASPFPRSVFYSYVLVYFIIKLIINGHSQEVKFVTISGNMFR